MQEKVAKQDRNGDANGNIFEVLYFHSERHDSLSLSKTPHLKAVDTDSLLRNKLPS